MDFSQKVVWITGASSGIGRQLALSFARKGAIVAATARRTEELNQLVAEIEGSGGKAAAFYCDVSEDDSIKACVAGIIEKLGQLDIAVANAGFGVLGKIEKLEASEWQRQLAVNVTGVALTAKYALPFLRKTSGRLVLIGSVAAYFPSPGVGAYAASKAAVRAIGQTLMVELKGSGVTCTTIHPGFVNSDIARVDNMGVLHKERTDPRPANLMWPTEKAAEVIVKAIYQRKGDFVFTGHGKIAVLIAKFFPGLARKISEKGPMPE
jgi:NAD(P)-dependent dehydrogenase (short-subunit alcohol dehydrogenase family)